MSLPAEILTIAANDPRAAVRRTLRLQVGARLSGGATEAEIHNLSEKGLLVETAVKLATGEILHLDLKKAGVIEATVVWSRGRLFGCEFNAALPKRIVSAALLRSPNERPGRDDASPVVQIPAREDGHFNKEMDDSSLPVLVISLVVLILAAIVGIYALLQSWALSH